MESPTDHQLQELKTFLEKEVDEALSGDDLGQVATYIPELADIDPCQLGGYICFANGKSLGVGYWNTPFSIQSISKVFSLAIALGLEGDDLWERVGKEPSGNPFNSIVQLEQENGRPRNPFINAGAIVTTDVMLGTHSTKAALGQLLNFIRTAAEDNSIFINKSVAKSEDETGFKNRSLANFLKAHSNLNNPVEAVLGAYFHQCAIEMTCKQLANAGRFLVNVPNFPCLIAPERIRRINSLMATCGHYDASGEFAFRVGLPGKSGVGGGILVIVPGKASIAVWSPGLNEQGNSLLGAKLAESMASYMNWSIF